MDIILRNFCLALALYISRLIKNKRKRGNKELKGAGISRTSTYIATGNRGTLIVAVNHGMTAFSDSNRVRNV